MFSLPGCSRLIFSDFCARRLRESELETEIQSRKLENVKVQKQAIINQCFQEAEKQRYYASVLHFSIYADN